MKDSNNNADFLTTEQKLKMSNVGSLKELQYREQSKTLSFKIILQSRAKLKTKQKSKYRLM